MIKTGGQARVAGVCVGTGPGSTKGPRNIPRPPSGWPRDISRPPPELRWLPCPTAWRRGDREISRGQFQGDREISRGHCCERKNTFATNSAAGPGNDARADGRREDISFRSFRGGPAAPHKGGLVSHTRSSHGRFFSPEQRPEGATSERIRAAPCDFGSKFCRSCLDVALLA